MKKQSFFLALFGLTLILLAVVLIIKHFEPSLIYTYTLYFLIYFFFLSLLNHQFIRFALKNTEGDFTSFYFVSMLIRFFLSITIIFVIIYVDRGNAVVASLNFLILYFIYLAFEVVALVKSLNSNSN